MKRSDRTIGIVISMFLLAIGTARLSAQEQTQAKTADTAKTAVKQEAARNMMLNASNDVGPRVVNIGLPASIGGTTILENGLPVVYHFSGQSPTRLWRAGNSFSSFKALSVGETAITAGDVGISVSTYSNKGTETFKGAAAVNSNSFGLVRADVNLSGPIKNGFYYSVNASLNLDPGTFNPVFTTFLDNTQIFKVVLNKKFKRGEIGIQYKYADSKGISSKLSPYIYHLDGTVSQFKDFRIGRDSYLERTGKTHVINPLTGQREVWDQMKDLGGINHVVDLLGNYKMGKGLQFDYVMRYNYAKAGLYNPYYSGVSSVKPESERYFYVDNPTEEYKSEYVQKILSLATPQIEQNTVMGRFDLSKKIKNHQLTIGLDEWYYNVDNSFIASSSFAQEVAAKPRKLLTETFDKTTGKWLRVSDEFGNSGYNGAALQYYTGAENKTAIYAMDKWMVSNSLDINVGARLEWQNVNGKWYPNASRDAAAKDGFKDGRIDMDRRVAVKKDWFNKAANLNVVYKVTPLYGFLGEVSYTEVAGNLSSYSGADDPNIEPSQIPGASLGVYLNHPLVSIVSKATFIERNNFKNNSTFQKGYKQTITYGIQTFGWTTDMEINPFKGFKLHMLLTLQNPKYKNFTIDLTGTPSEGGVHYLSGGVARSVSKTLIEFDPSYTYKNLRVWASARYFSKEAANYPNTLWFASRVETFAGVNYKINKNIDFAVSAVNLLNQKGAQGSISGTNTTTAEEAAKLEGKVLTGTYIRPFTVEFGVKVKF